MSLKPGTDALAPAVPGAVGPAEGGAAAVEAPATVAATVVAKEGYLPLLSSTASGQSSYSRRLR